MSLAYPREYRPNRLFPIQNFVTVMCEPWARLPKGHLYRPTWGRKLPRCVVPTASTGLGTNPSALVTVTDEPNITRQLIRHGGDYKKTTAVPQYTRSTTKTAIVERQGSRVPVRYIQSKTRLDRTAGAPVLNEFHGCSGRPRNIWT